MTNPDLFWKAMLLVTAALSGTVIGAAIVLTGAM